MLQEYEQESEGPEHVGERLALLDDDGRALTVVEITDVRVRRFVDVPWEFAAAEGEGDEDLAQWRAGHRRYWVAQGAPVDDDTEVVRLDWARLDGPRLERARLDLSSVLTALLELADRPDPHPQLHRWSALRRRAPLVGRSCGDPHVRQCGPGSGA